MKNIKRVLSIIGCAVFLSVFIIGAVSCNKGSSSAGGGGAGTLTPGKLPYGDGKTTLTMFVRNVSDRVSDFSYEKNTWTKALVDATGIKLDITSANYAIANERINVMLSTGTYPEVIIHNISMNDMNYYASQGILKPMDENALARWPNIKAAFDEFPAVFQRIRGVDGKVYALPDINDCLHCVYSYGRVWYYMPWMRDHGFKEPQTTAELESYLRYVISNDMNKNGQKNAMGIAFDSGSLRNFIAYFAKPFLPWVYGSQYGVALDGKTVVAQYRDTRFRDALKWMNSLYKQGYIVPDSFTMTGDQLKSLWQGSTPRVAILAATWMNGYTDQGTERWINTFGLPAIEGPNGQRNAGNGEPWTILGGRMFITDKLKNPELVYALYDYMQNFEVMMNGYIGPKGIGWADPDPGTSSLSGGTPLYKLLVSYGNDAINSTWDQANPMIRSGKFRLGEQATNTREAEQWLTTHSNDTALMNKLLADTSYPEQMWYRTSLANSKYMMKPEIFLPPIGMDEADNSRYSDINAVLSPFLDRAFVEFITGARDINSDAAWNAYIAELDQLNQPEAIRILQKYIK